MVKKRLIFLLNLLSFYWLTILQAEPLVDASIDSSNSQAHFPLQGTITITHDKEEKIDSKSFTLDGKSIDTSLVKDVKMSASSDTFVTIYSFQLPAQDKGLYVLPSISVKIEGKKYSTIPSSYEVHEVEATPSSFASPSSPSSNLASTPSSSPTIFRLEASVEGPTTLYPGERTKLLYRILYNRSVDLTRSELPMVHPAHFRKVGDVQIKDYQLQDTTVQDLTQEVEASDLGTFSFGPSEIEGYAYTMQTGQKIYDSNLLKAQAPVITLNVKPFPSANQPASFTGALGKIDAKASLTSSSSLAVGDTIQLKIAITGVTNLTELHIPSLQCQPGFSGFFQTSDIPPLSEVKDQTKLFYVELRPLTALINKIPEIEVSSFDSDSGQYIVQDTSSIAVTIMEQPFNLTFSSSIPMLMPSVSFSEWPAPQLSSLELVGSIVPQIYKTHSWQKGIWIILTMLLASIFLVLQKFALKKWQEKSKTQVSPSEKIFKQALKKKDLHLLEQAFWQRLWERGIIPKGTFQIDKLPNHDKLIPLSSFLLQLQALQYSANKAYHSSQLQREAKEFFDLI